MPSQTKTSVSNLSDYTATINGRHGYIAGLPSYPRNFSRDVILAGLIAMDEDLLLSQIELSSLHQGTRYDPATGEEPGKVHHEFPGVVVREPYLTTYNACDTTALYLIAIEALLRTNPDRHTDIATIYRPQILAALRYLTSHVNQALFWEYPPAGAAAYSLRVTYWKDSIVPDSTAHHFNYPLSYALAHFQAARGMLSASFLLNSQELQQLSDEMFKVGIAQFIRKKHFCVMLDESNRLEQASSDELHSLAYIPACYRQSLPWRAIKKRARQLTTPVGIACTPKLIADTLSDTYHGYVVWPFEQALIHYGAKKFGLTKVATIAKRSTEHIAQGNELIQINPVIKPDGNDRQLWSVAASTYFSQPTSDISLDWL